MPIAAAVGGAILSSVLSKVVGRVFGGDSGGGGDTAAPPPPPIPKPVTMPLPDDQAALAARRRSLAMQVAQHGRASTVLSDQSEKLGGN